ncbi:hypothetical protein ABZ322_16550, partial [Streptomyces sp. NPDC006129]
SDTSQSISSELRPQMQLDTPAEARPGISPDDRRILAENVTTPPTPRNGAVRGTMGKPQLPRRRAQEHIAPQLRDGPAPRQDSEYLVGHDPGLMAAFQRGISLAEAQQNMEAGNMEWGDTTSSHRDPTHRDPIPRQPAHLEPLSTELSSSTTPASVDAHRTTEARGVRDGTGPSRPDHTTTRHDGSAPAG